MSKPRVLLLGDSIRLGYQKYVADNLKDVADVYCPKENGRDTTFTLWTSNQIFLHEGKFDIIHWNNGYWDMNIEAPMTEPLRPLPEYRYQLQRLIDLFKTQSKKIIWANSVPIERSGSSEDNTGTGAIIHYDNQWVIDYNKAAAEVMSKNKIPVNDLYSLCLKGPNYYKKDDHLHLTEDGYQVVAKQIDQQVRAMIKNL